MLHLTACSRHPARQPHPTVGMHVMLGLTSLDDLHACEEANTYADSCMQVPQGAGADMLQQWASLLRSGQCQACS